MLAERPCFFVAIITPSTYDLLGLRPCVLATSVEVTTLPLVWLVVYEMVFDCYHTVLLAEAIVVCVLRQ